MAKPEGETPVQGQWEGTDRKLGRSVARTITGAAVRSYTR